MADKAKRTMLTPEQRVAKIEAQLAAAKAKAEAANNKQINVLLERRASLTKRANTLAMQVNVVDTQLLALGAAEQLSKVSGEVGLDENDQVIITSTDVGQFV